MKKFRVYAKYEQYCFADIEAKTKEEAEEIAENMDGGDFDIADNGLDDGNWHIVNTMTEEFK